MVSQKNKNSNLHKIFLNLAFEKAKINLGITDGITLQQASDEALALAIALG